MTETCIGCGSKALTQVFDLGRQPFANALLQSADAPEKNYPLELRFCKTCALAQLGYIADPKELFSNYVWVTASSASAQTYSRLFCERVLQRAENKKNAYILEAASNDGTFLKPFQEKGYPVFGIDPATNIVQCANENGIPTIAAFFSEDTAARVVAEKGHPSIVFARNVLPHVKNLHDFIKGLAYCCGEDTLLAVEFHYSGKILDELHYDSIYHEHLCYFTLHSVQNVLARHGLYPFDIDLSPISGGSFVLYLRKTKQPMSEKLQQFFAMERERKYNALERWIEFGVQAQEHKQALNALIDEQLAQGKKIVGYGASARSSTLLNYCGIDSTAIRVIADQNPRKQGLFTPGTHIQIVSPEQAMAQNPDTVLLLAWNFEEEIKGILRDRFHFEGEIILPLPHLPRKERLSCSKSRL